MTSIAKIAVPQEDAAALLAECGALKSGHFLLSSGLHSPQYFQCATLLEYPAVAERVVGAMAPMCAELRPETILSPALGAILFGYELSRTLGCRNIFAERPEGKFELRRGFTLRPGERVLIAENVVTTGGSVEETAQMAIALGADVVGYALLVDRSGGKFAPGLPVLAYAAFDAVTTPAEACPQCVVGVPLTKSGSRNFGPGQPA